MAPQRVVMNGRRDAVACNLILVPESGDNGLGIHDVEVNIGRSVSIRSAVTSVGGVYSRNYSKFGLGVES